MKTYGGGGAGGLLTSLILVALLAAPMIVYPGHSGGAYAGSCMVDLERYFNVEEEDMGSLLIVNITPKAPAKGNLYIMRLSPEETVALWTYDNCLLQRITGGKAPVYETILAGNELASVFSNPIWLRAYDTGQGIVAVVAAEAVRAPGDEVLRAVRSLSTTLEGAQPLAGATRVVVIIGPTGLDLESRASLVASLASLDEALYGVVSVSSEFEPVIDVVVNPDRAMLPEEAILGEISRITASYAPTSKILVILSPGFDASIIPLVAGANPGDNHHEENKILDYSIIGAILLLSAGLTLYVKRR